jgi:FkbM family methyltransferase
MDLPLFERLRQLHLPAPQGVLQIGASYGQELALFAQNGLARGVFVEPLPAPFQHLASQCRKVPGWVAVNTLCSDVAGQTIDFHVASNGGMSSSMLEPDVHKALYPGITFGEKVQITSTTVDQLAAFLRANGHAAAIDACDLLFMDCQGAEFRILMGAPATLRQIRYIYMEVMRGSLYKDQVPFLTYCTWLEAMGFTLNDVAFAYPENAGNALFVRKDLIGLA